MKVLGRIMPENHIEGVHGEMEVVLFARIRVGVGISL